MPDKKLSAYNPYFLVPYAIWLLVGGILLFFFDKQVLFAFVNTRHTAISDVLMYYISDMGEGYTITIILLLLLAVTSLRNWWYFITALLCIVLPTLVTQLVKHIVNAPRPLHYFNKAAWVHIAPEWPRYMEQSFPSGHTTGAFSMFCLLSMLLPARYRAVGILFLCLGLSVAWSRLYLAAHFFADVYAGSIIGGMGTIIVFAVMNRYRENFFAKNSKK